MTAFTPWQSLIGGLLIGLSTALMILFLGKIAGISGIIDQLWQGSLMDRQWRGAFTLGLLLSPLAYRLVTPLPEAIIAADWPQLVMAGLLVGFGTRLGSGCTSGHGVCGLSRLSIRSLVATLIFMATAIVVVWLTRHVLA